MNATLPLLLLAPLSLTALDGPEETRVDEQAANVLRTYDVHALVPGGFSPEGQGTTSLVPFVEFDAEDPWYEEGDSLGGLGDIEGLIYEVMGDEFEYEGRQVNVDDRGTLYVFGPEALQTRVSELLRFLESTVGAQVMLEVAVVSIDVPADPGTLWPAEELDSMFAEARAAGRAFQVPIQGDRMTVMDSSTTRALCVDYQVEIAQGAAIGDPIVLTLSTGMRLQLLASPSESGTYLTFSLKNGDLLGVDDRIVDLGGRISHEGGAPVKVTDSGVLQSYQILSRSLASSVHLPTGSAIVLPTDVAGHGAEVVVARVVGSLPTEGVFDLGDRGQLALRDLGACVPPRLEARGLLVRGDGVPDHLTNHMEHLMLGSRLKEGDLGLAEELVLGSVEWNNFNSIGRWAAMYGHSTDDEDLSRSRAEQERVSDRFRASQPASAQFEVDVRVSHGGQGTVAARTLVLDGHETVLAVGTESTGIFDYDVEVAQNASVAEPRVATVFDGLALWMQPTARADGGVTLRLRGGAHHGGQQGNNDLDSDMYPLLDNLQGAHTLVGERRVLTANADGTWSTVIGGGADGPRIEVTLRRP